MEQTSFWKSYGIVTTFILLCLAVLQMFIPETEALNLFSMVAIACFSIVLILVFFRSRQAVDSADPYRFIRLMLLLFLVKFFLCVILVAIYWNYREPNHRAAILPFFVIYIFYTIFEVYFLNKIARASPGQNTQQIIDEQNGEHA